MSLYPPLTEANLTTLNAALITLSHMGQEVCNSGVSIVLRPGDEDTLMQEVSDLRGKVAAYDLALFRIYGLVHRLKESNVPTTLPPPKPRAVPLTTDVLEDLLK